jgi:hypothetical protein
MGRIRVCIADITLSRSGYSLQAREQDCERTTLAAKPVLLPLAARRRGAAGTPAAGGKAEGLLRVEGV